MTDPQKAQFRVEQAEVVGAMRMAFVRRLKRPVFIGLVVVIYALMGVVVWLDGWYQFPTLLLACALAVPVFVIVAVYFIVPFTARRHFRQSALLHDDVTIEWDAVALSMSGQHGRARIPWNLFHAWSENEQLFIVHQSEILFNMIPKRALDDTQSSNLRTCLEGSGVKRI